MEEGLRILRGVKARGFAILTDIHEPAQAGTAAEVADILDLGIELRTGVADLGTGTRTVLAMVVAEEFGLKEPEGTLTVVVGGKKTVLHQTAHTSCGHNRLDSEES